MHRKTSLVYIAVLHSKDSRYELLEKARPKLKLVLVYSIYIIFKVYSIYYFGLISVNG